MKSLRQIFSSFQSTLIKIPVGAQKRFSEIRHSYFSFLSSQGQKKCDER